MLQSCFCLPPFGGHNSTLKSQTFQTFLRQTNKMHKTLPALSSYQHGLKFRRFPLFHDIPKIRKRRKHRDKRPQHLFFQSVKNPNEVNKIARIFMTQRVNRLFNSRPAVLCCPWKSNHFRLFKFCTRTQNPNDNADHKNMDVTDDETEKICADENPDLPVYLDLECGCLQTKSMPTSNCREFIEWTRLDPLISKLKSILTSWT